MLYAQKDNRQYPISEDERQKYINQGYKIGRLEGNRIVFEKIQSPKAITISKLTAKNEFLNKELEKARAENEELKAQLADKEPEPEKGKAKKEVDKEPEENKKAKGEGK